MCERVLQGWGWVWEREKGQPLAKSLLPILLRHDAQLMVLLFETD